MAPPHQRQLGGLDGHRRHHLRQLGRVPLPLALPQRRAGQPHPRPGQGPGPPVLSDPRGPSLSPTSSRTRNSCIASAVNAGERSTLPSKPASGRRYWASRAAMAGASRTRSRRPGTGRSGGAPPRTRARRARRRRRRRRPGRFLDPRRCARARSRGSRPLRRQACGNDARWQAAARHFSRDRPTFTAWGRRACSPSGATPPGPRAQRPPPRPADGPAARSPPPRAAARPRTRAGRGGPAGGGQVLGLARERRRSPRNRRRVEHLQEHGRAPALGAIGAAVAGQAAGQRLDQQASRSPCGRGRARPSAAAPRAARRTHLRRSSARRAAGVDQPTGPAKPRPLGGAGAWSARWS